VEQGLRQFGSRDLTPTPDAPPPRVSSYLRLKLKLGICITPTWPFQAALGA
jgi:hypothetical protein